MTTKPGMAADAVGPPEEPPARRAVSEQPQNTRKPVTRGGVVRKKSTMSVIVLALAVAVWALALSGCGSSSSSTGGSAPASTTTASSAIQTTAQKLVAPYEKLPPASAYPTLPAINPGTANAAVMSCSFSNDCLLSGEQAVDAFRAMGWKSDPTQNGNFSTATWSAFMARAASQHLAGVVLIGIDVNTISASVNEAVSAGVKIACVFCQSGAQWNGKVYDVGPNLQNMGYVATMEAIAEYGTNLKLVDFNSPGTDAIVERHLGVASTIAKYCPSCSFHTVTVNNVQLGEPGPPPWDSYLETHPQGTVNYVIGPFDNLDNEIAKTDQSEGRTDVQVGGYGFAGALPYIEDGQEQSIVTYGFGYYGYLAAEVIALLHANKPVPAGLTSLPVMLVTKNNVNIVADNDNAGHYIAPPGDWQKTFLTSWGKA
jgi:ABC-type sugar transport system substrate-binding protein